MYPTNLKQGLDQKLTDLLTKFAEENNLGALITVHASPTGAFIHGQFEFEAKGAQVPAEPDAPVVPAEPAAPAVPRDGPIKAKPLDDDGPATISTVQASLIEQTLREHLGIGANLFDSLKQDTLLVTREHGGSQVLCLIKGALVDTGVMRFNVRPLAMVTGPDVKYTKANPMAMAQLSSISMCWLPSTVRGQKVSKGEPVAYRTRGTGTDEWKVGTVISQRADGTVLVAPAGAQLNSLSVMAAPDDCWTQVPKQTKPATPAPKAQTKADKRRSMKPGAK